ncbi:MAG: type II toxin-antitoxin system VapC family toxin [Bacteroidota bacterium]
MTQTQYLIDTNLVVDYLSERLSNAAMRFMDEVVNNIPNISVVTKIELLSLNITEEHMDLVHAFINDSIILDLSPNVVKNTIGLCKTHKLDLNIAVLAATALTYNYTLITNNESQYAHIKGLSLISPKYIS